MIAVFFRIRIAMKAMKPVSKYFPYACALRLCLFIPALALAVSTSAVHAQSVDVPTIAAASDLKFAVEEIAAAFAAGARSAVKLTFGSSGNFFTQISQGAPFQLFMSADEALVFQLADSGRTMDRGALYATGRLVLFAPHGSPLSLDPQLAGLKAALAAGRIQRFAIANPDHAPYGRASEQALASVGLWETVRPRLVLGENVSQAAQFAISGSTQGGMFAYSLSFAPEIVKAGSHILVPENLHQPLRQRMVLLKGAGETARAFYAYLRQPAARSVFKRYGFVLPGE